MHLNNVTEQIMKFNHEIRANHYTTINCKGLKKIFPLIIDSSDTLDFHVNKFYANVYYSYCSHYYGS